MTSLGVDHEREPSLVADFDSNGLLDVIIPITETGTPIEINETIGTHRQAIRFDPKLP